MEKSIESKLFEMPASKLVKIILAALEMMYEEALNNFIAKHIEKYRMGGNFCQAVKTINDVHSKRRYQNRLRRRIQAS